MLPRGQDEAHAHKRGHLAGASGPLCRRLTGVEHVRSVTVARAANEASVSGNDVVWVAVPAPPGSPGNERAD